MARAGQISPDAAVSLAQVLAQVPGVDQSIVDVDAPRPTRESGKEKKDND